MKSVGLIQRSARKAKVQREEQYCCWQWGNAASARAPYSARFFFRRRFFCRGRSPPPLPALGARPHGCPRRARFIGYPPTQQRFFPEKVRVTDRVVLGASAVGGRTPGLRTSLLRHKTRVVTVAVVWVHVPRWICSSVGS